MYSHFFPSVLIFSLLLSFLSREKKERSTLSWYSDNSTCPFSLARPRENGQKEKGAPQNRRPTASYPVLKGSSCFHSSLYFRRWVNRILSISGWRLTCQLAAARIDLRKKWRLEHFKCRVENKSETPEVHHNPPDMICFSDTRKCTVIFSVSLDLFFSPFFSIKRKERTLWKSEVSTMTYNSVSSSGRCLCYWITPSPTRPTEKMTIRTFQVSRRKQIWDSWGAS